MQLSTISGVLQPLKRGHEGTNHLLFADDMLVFCKGNDRSASTLNNLLEDLNTGLQINKEKSKLFLSKGCKCKSELVQILGVAQGTLPMKYLAYLSLLYTPKVSILHLSWIRPEVKLMDGI